MSEIDRIESKRSEIMREETKKKAIQHFEDITPFRWENDGKTFSLFFNSSKTLSSHYGLSIFSDHGTNTVYFDSIDDAVDFSYYKSK